ncbi:lipase family protein [Spirosoma oryzicola]|uniref:lipase family protein n=1 Tax=Spirosoma oryzicola TaxID=2898794 RepID=UPI001E568929|nr:hypothetical protein [Spirosoma oryzicola]UHG94712.1 hypothetical protein LQ777_29380 [Spirosoma oryzicola]
MTECSVSLNPQAAVHAGWLIGTAYLIQDILPKLDSCIHNGTKEFIITVMSQGGAIAFLVTSYLYHQRGGRLPAEVRFKTYCIAAPKPGNLSYAYDYAILTQDGWGFNVVNSADWVPQFPFSVQTTDDFNLTNPIPTITKAIKKQSLFNQVAFNYVFKRLDKPSRQAQRRYQKLLGGYVGKMVQKTLPAYHPPSYVASSYFVQTGQTVVLNTDAAYYQQFPEDANQLFKNHFYKPYLYLMSRLN